MAALLTACSSPAVNEPVETTAAEESSVQTQESAAINPEAEYPICFKEGETAEFDLDGDGSMDTVTYRVESEDVDMSVVTVNGIDYESLSFPTDSFWICDIDTSDNALEVAVSSYGPSDDYSTEFYRLESGTLNSIGEIYDMIDGSLEGNYPSLSPMFKSSAKFNGDGTITAAVRLDIFQTWFAYTTYTYNKVTGVIEEHSDMYYPYGEENSRTYKDAFNAQYGGLDMTDINLPTTNAEINLFLEMKASSETVVFEPQKFMATATDNEHWVYIVGEDGTAGWLHITDGYSTALDAENGEEFDYMSVMENLYLYD